MQSSLQGLSWEDYCETVKLPQLLTDGANACFAAKTARPEAFLAQLFRKNTAADVVSKVRAEEVLDGYGGYSVAIEVTLTSGRKLRKVVSTTPLLGLHPSTARKTTFSTAVRAATPVMTTPSPPPAKGEVPKPKPPPVAQRYDSVASFVSTAFAATFAGASVMDQRACDDIILSSDGTSTLSTMLAPTAAALSLMCAQMAATILSTPLYRHISSLSQNVRPYVGGIPAHLKTAAFFLPRPIISILGTEPRHMGRVRVREVALIPTFTHTTRSTAAAAVASSNHAKDQASSDAGSSAMPSPRCAPFACFSPKLITRLQSIYDILMVKLDEPPVNADGTIKYNGYETLAQTVEMLEEAIKESNTLAGGAGGGPQTEFQIALIVDGSLCFRPDTSKYTFIEGTEYTGAQLAETLAQLCKDKKIAYIEDPHHENDVVEMRRLMNRVGATTTIAGNNIFAGDAATISRGATEMVANNMVVRVSDHGTLSTAVQNAELFINGYRGATLTVTAETNESDGASVADVAVGLGARFLRVGGLLRNEHAAVLSRLLSIQQELEENNTLIPPPMFEEWHLELPPAPLEPVADVNAKDTKKKK